MRFLSVSPAILAAWLALVLTPSQGLCQGRTQAWSQPPQPQPRHWVVTAGVGIDSSRLRQDLARYVTVRSQISYGGLFQNPTVFSSRLYSPVVPSLRLLPVVLSTNSLAAEATSAMDAWWSRQALGISSAAASDLARHFAVDPAAEFLQGVSWRLLANSTEVAGALDDALGALKLAADMTHYAGRSLQIINPPVFLNGRTVDGWRGQGRIGLPDGQIDWEEALITGGPGPIARTHIEQVTALRGSVTTKITETIAAPHFWDRWAVLHYPAGGYFDLDRTTISWTRTSSSYTADTIRWSQSTVGDAIGFPLASLPAASHTMPAYVQKALSGNLTQADFGRLILGRTTFSLPASFTSFRIGSTFSNWSFRTYALPSFKSWNVYVPAASGTFSAWKP